jgi:hypothetical protein
VCKYPSDIFNVTVYEYYLKNYLTGETTYRFKEPIKLWGKQWRGAINDQYGQYLFLDKDGDLILFDVREKREIAPGEPLKRSEYVYYTEQRIDPARRPKESFHLLRYNLSTRQIVEVNTRNTISMAMLADTYRTLEDLGNNQLLLYNDYSNWVLQLNESMVEVLSFTAREINTQNTREYTAHYIIPLDEGKYLGFVSTREGLGLMDEVDKYCVNLLDEKGAIEKEYRDINMLHSCFSGSTGGYTLLSPVCLVSPDKQYALFFDDKLNTFFSKIYVYKILY